MQTVETITVSEDGVIRFLVHENTTPLVQEGALIRRASHVEPVRTSLRLVFHGLRGVFGEKGRVADWTRGWACDWRINLAPTSGPILPAVYPNRAEAISAEINYLNEFFI